jgi:two-component system, chemotaxis family, response regulator Rcp1
MEESGLNPSQGKDQPSTSRFPSEEGATRKPRILIVEDSKADVYLIRAAIDKEGIHAQLEVVRDGQAATQYIDSADANDGPCPELILLDMNLPKKSGDEVLRHLRSSTRCRFAKVLIVSSSDTLRGRLAVENLAIVGYFKKPTSYAEFLKLGPLVKGALGS